MEKLLQSKASKNELNTAINLKANTTEVMRAFSDLSSAIDNRSTIEETRNLLNDKISKSELLYYLNSKPSLEDIKNLIDDKVDYRNFNNEINELKLNYDDLNKNFNNKINNFALNKDLNNIKKILDEKANLIDVNNALNKKANKDTIIESLENKVNKNEIEIILNNKLDKNDLYTLKNIIETKVDKITLDNILNSVLNSKAEVNDFKLISDAFQDMKTTMTKRIDDIDNDLDRLIENIKTQFQSLNVVINNLENNKVEIGNFEKVSMGISKKADIEKVDSSINKLKNEMFETINEFKNDVIGSRKKFEDKLNEKFTLLQNDSKNILNSINNEKESLQIFYQKKENENILEKTKGIMDKTLNEINQKISELKISYDKYFSNIKNDLSQKIDITKMNEILSQITNDMSQKISSNEIEELNNIILEINKRIEEFENNYSLELNNKISKKELNSLLNDKISKREISLNEISLLKEQTEKNENEIKTKLDITKFESIIKSFNKCFDNVKSEMDTKANSKEIYNIIKNKVEIEDINKALLEIHNELDKKSSNEDFTNAMDNQAIINDTLCNENCLGRWFWKSGKLKNGYAIPWEIQSINTSPDNFIWNKDKTFINIIESGLYELNVGFFNDKKSSIQILVNGDVVINVNPNNNFHNKGKNTNKILSSNGNVVGISFIDFIMLGEQSKIAVSYTGMEGGFGFMGLKKM